MPDDVGLTLPVGFDRADGQDGRIGTPVDASCVRVQVPGMAVGEVVNIDGIPINEDHDSPTIERAEQCTVVHRFTMSFDVGLTLIGTIGRGSLAEDSYGNLFFVLSARLSRNNGAGTATLEVVTEGKSFDSPPDEFNVVPVELGINIIKHPRYFYAFLGDGYGSTTEQNNQMVIRLLQDYMSNTSAAYRNALTQLLKDSLASPTGAGGSQPPTYTAGAGFDPAARVSGTEMAKRAALEIIQKYWRGEETPYIVGWEVTWSQYFFVSPSINPGGYVENPMTESVPQLPEYFFSNVFPPDPAQTIFDLMAVANPQCYSTTGTDSGSVNISWLRMADRVDYQRTWFRITRTWRGAAFGHWDEQIYSRGSRPLSAGDYLTTA